jgi:DNA replication protein DnaC
MYGLKLHGMAKGFEQRLSSVKNAGISHGEFVGLLMEDEKLYRENRRLQRLLGKARLRQPAAMEDVDYRHTRGLSRQVMAELSGSRWLETHRTVILTGSTGTGKSYLACALGNHGARAGFTVQYYRASRLFEQLLQARGDGTHLKLLTPMTDNERRDFFEIVEERYECSSMVIASQCPVTRWHEGIGDETIADAICDRLFHNAYKIELTGPSIREEEEKGSRSEGKGGGNLESGAKKS